MTAREFSVSTRLRSFVYAARGVRVLLSSQHNAWIHTVATLGVIVSGVKFELLVGEWVALILAIVVVWAAEALNTSVEFLSDAVSRDFHPLIEKAKDVAAGAVLICALGAGVIGLLILGPHFLALWG